MSAPLVEVAGLAKTFDVSAPWLNRVAERKPRQFVHAVDDVGFTIARGKTLALVGESGCGKSTVARLLVGLYTPTRGRVVFDGVDAGAAGSARPASIRRRMQMIFQDPYASLNPRWKVSDIVAEPLREHGFGVEAASGAKETRQRIDDRVGDAARVGRPGAGRRRQVPAPVLGRPAPAHLDRARARDPARVPGLRRADLGARRVGAGAGPQHHEGPAGASTA